MAEEELASGVANAGSVTRVGDYVLRPSTPHSASIHRLLRWLRAEGFDGVPMPVGHDPDGRERLTFRAGDVALPPYPMWAQSDQALASIAFALAAVPRRVAVLRPIRDDLELGTGRPQP
jgi:hypothetical protein